MENTGANLERPPHMEFNQESLNDLLDGKFPWHKDAKYMARECNALCWEVGKKKQRTDKDDRHLPRCYERRDDRRDDGRCGHDDNHDKDQDDNFPHLNKEVNFIIDDGGRHLGTLLEGLAGCYGPARLHKESVLYPDTMAPTVSWLCNGMVISPIRCAAA